MNAVINAVASAFGRAALFAEPKPAKRQEERRREIGIAGRMPSMPNRKGVFFIMLQCVIFDFDGTVGDTLPICIEGFRRTLETVAERPFSDEEIIAAFGPSEEGSFMRLLPDRFEEGLAAYLKHYRELHESRPEPFPGVREVLSLLRKSGVRTALVTGKGAGSCRISLERFGMLDAFDLVRTGRKEGPNKPEDIRLVLEAFGLAGTDAFYVGDQPSDIVAARTAGVIPLAAAWADSANPDALRKEKPAALFRTVTDLRAFLEQELEHRFAAISGARAFFS